MFGHIHMTHTHIWRETECEWCVYVCCARYKWWEQGDCTYRLWMEQIYKHCCMETVVYTQTTRETNVFVNGMFYILQDCYEKRSDEKQHDCNVTVTNKHANKSLNLPMGWLVYQYIQHTNKTHTRTQRITKHL